MADRAALEVGAQVVAGGATGRARGKDDVLVEPLDHCGGGRIGLARGRCGGDELGRKSRGWSHANRVTFYPMKRIGCGADLFVRASFFPESLAMTVRLTLLPITLLSLA